MQNSNHEQSNVSLLAESDKDPEKQENGLNDLQLTVRRDENQLENDIDGKSIS